MSVTQILILATAVIPSVVAMIAIVFHRKIARQKATLEFIHTYNNDKRVSHGHQVILRHTDQPLDEYLKPGGAEFDNFLFVMNMFEILAIGLKRGIYDKNMALDMFGDDLRHIYTGAKTLIDHIRKTGPDSYRHVEDLADSIKTSHNIK